MRQTAVAHRIIFEEIENIVRADTGQSLQWRHLHTNSIDETDGMILQWVADQHGGQAKGVVVHTSHPVSCFISFSGLGLHFQKLSQRLTGKFDLHEPSHLLSDLFPYEHLHRLYHLCTSHVRHNIQKCPVSEEVRNLMHSLICTEHDDWDGALGKIGTLGAKARRGMALHQIYYNKILT